MKRIIALFGHANCGKTQTLNYLREMIRENGGISLSNDSPCTEDTPEAFRYKNMIVSICPGGDFYEAILENFEYSKANNADIIITASRCRGEGPALISQKGEENNIEIKWYPKSYEYKLSEDTQDACNREYAKVIFDAL